MSTEDFDFEALNINALSLKKKNSVEYEDALFTILNAGKQQQKSSLRETEYKDVINASNILFY